MCLCPPLSPLPLAYTLSPTHLHPTYITPIHPVMTLPTSGKKKPRQKPILHPMHSNCAQHPCTAPMHRYSSWFSSLPAPMHTTHAHHLCIVVQVGFLLCLHLHDTLYKVLMVDLQPIPPESQHPCLYTHRLELCCIEIITGACQLFKVDIRAHVHLAGVDLWVGFVGGFRGCGSGSGRGRGCGSGFVVGGMG